MRLSDVAEVTDSVEDIRTTGLADGKPSVLLIIYRQPGANIIDTVDRIERMMPQLQASIPPAMKLSVLMDRTTTIRASVHDVEVTLLISICLVVLVVFLFLRDFADHADSQRGGAGLAPGDVRHDVSDRLHASIICR